MLKKLKPCKLYNEIKTVTDYQQAWRYQRVMTEHAGVERKKGNPVPDSLILVQHQSLYTLGRGATLDNLKFSPHELDCPHSVYRVERGGEVTWHGPGQIVCYPILDLHNHKKDLHWYTNALEQTVIDALAALEIKGERSKVNTGVWVGQNKICAVGVTASRWVTMHGLALNVTSDLTNYEKIVPCGISLEGYGVCRVENFHPTAGVEAVAEALLLSFSKVFEVEFQPCELSSLQATMDSYPSLSSAALDKKIS